MHYDVSFPYIFLRIYPELKMNNVKFGFQNRNSKKHGHFKKKTNKKTNEVSYEIKIERNDNDAAKIYTFLHEYAHYYNKHLDSKEITGPQKEWVAHEVAMYFIKHFELQKQIKKSNLSKKWNIDNYSKIWMKDRRISIKQQQLMENQLENTIKHLKFILSIA